MNVLFKEKKMERKKRKIKKMLLKNVESKDESNHGTKTDTTKWKIQKRRKRETGSTNSKENFEIADKRE